MQSSVSDKSIAAAPLAPRSPLVAVALAFAVGIGLSRSLGLAFPIWWSSALAAWTFWLHLWNRQRSRLATCSLLVALLFTAGAWHNLHWQYFVEDEIGRFAREEQEPFYIECIATSAPVRIASSPPDPLRAIPSYDQTRFEARITGLRDGSIWRSAAGRTTVAVDGHLLGVRSGDRLRVLGSVARVTPPANPGDFDFAGHARADRQLTRVRCSFPECITVIQQSSLLSAGRWLDSIRHAGQAALWRHIDTAQAGLASAILLGTREQVDREQTDAFLTTGTIHILSISGLHVGLLSGMLFVALRTGFLQRTHALVGVAALTTFYTYLTGAEPPAIRAGIMVLIVCGGLLWGRKAPAFNALAAAALVVLMLNPADLFRVGPQLSFLAVGSLIWLAQRWDGSRDKIDPLDRLIASTRPWPYRWSSNVGRWFWRMTAAGAVIWIVALPLVMARFHLVSPVGLVLNTLLAVPVLLTMSCGFATIVASAVFPAAGNVFGSICSINLELLDRSITWFNQLPGNHFWVAGPSDWWLAGFYAVVIFAALCPRFAPPMRWCIAILAGWTAFGIVASASAKSHDELRCSFISVGHGCSVMIELPAGQTMLYDAGSLSSPASAMRSISSTLWSRGVTHLDAVVLSHADVDHYNALPELLERFSVGVVYVSPVMFYSDSDALTKLSQSLAAYNVPVREVWGGDQLRTNSSAAVHVLHPPEDGVLGSDNANSIVLALEYAGRRMLLPGDLEGSGMRAVLAELPYDCDVVLAPHHGSQLSDPTGFSAWCTPEWTIISGGFNADAASVAAKYQASGSQTLHTATDGAVEVTVSPTGNLDVNFFRKHAASAASF